MAAKDVDRYIAATPPEVRIQLERVRSTIRKAAPRAQERMSYQMPAYFEDGVLVYFGAFKRHIGLFPPVRDAGLRAAVKPYAGPKGNLQFPLDQPIPFGLIRRIVQARIRANRARRASKERRLRS